MARIPRGSCAPSSCPQPPVSDAEERAPYCPTWANQLTTSAFGRLILSIRGCLYALKSKCRGYLFYNPDTEQVTVENPPYVSSNPKATNYGFLAKIVPTPTIICVDGVDTCETEIRQELAAQILNESSCGSLLIANSPICGDVPPSDSADLQNQVHVDYLAPKLHEDIGCPTDVRFLVQTPGKRGSGRNAVDCDQWSLMRRLKLRASQWGFIEADSSDAARTRQLVILPVSGGDDTDPCWEVRVLQAGETEVNGLTFHPIDEPPAISFDNNANGTVNRTLPSFPTGLPVGAKIQARFECKTTVTAATSNGGVSKGELSLNARDMTGIWLQRSADARHNAQVDIPVTAAAVSFTAVFVNGGEGAVFVFTVKLLGYSY